LRRVRRGAVVIVGAAIAAMFLPGASGLIERQYSDRLYAVVQRVLTRFSNQVPFALLDALALTVALAWGALAWRDLRLRGRWRGARAIAARTIVWSAATYLLFLATWGLNYRRVPLQEKLSYDQTAVTPDAVRAAASRAVDRLNALYGRAHVDGWPAPGVVDPALATAFARALRDTRLNAATLPARPKTTVLDWYFRKSGTDGMTDPFFLETLLATNVLPFERPFVVAHEWSHLAGLGDEGEANFVGWLTCMRGGAATQYSGALFLYGELAATLSPGDRSAIARRLDEGPRRDLQAIHARYVRDVSPRLSAAGWRIYDSYLRANRVEAGAASYAEVVTLVLGVRLSDPVE
jgi:hypothetical protein